jgi:8-oxo-dGTP diphosphatase
MVFKHKPSDFKKRFDIVGCFIQYEGKFVLLRRHGNKTHGGKWGLPAGKVETTESLNQAVIREIKEETGLSLEKATLDYFASLYVRDNSFDIEWHMFSITLKIRPIIAINPQEHSEFKWVTAPEALRLDLIHDLPESIKLFITH